MYIRVWESKVQRGERKHCAWEFYPYNTFDLHISQLAIKSFVLKAFILHACRHNQVHTGSLQREWERENANKKCKLRNRERGREINVLFCLVSFFWGGWSVRRPFCVSFAQFESAVSRVQKPLNGVCMGEGVLWEIVQTDDFLRICHGLICVFSSNTYFRQFVARLNLKKRLFRP